MKTVLTSLLVFGTGLLSASPTEEFKEQERSVFPYVDVGVSTFYVALPYAASVGAGMRFAEQGSPLGVDISGNFVQTPVSRFLGAKLLTPIYLKPSDPMNSFYAGPFVAGGLDTQITRTHFADKGSSAILIPGLTFGKNKKVGNSIAFTQVNVNLAKIDLNHPESSRTRNYQRGQSLTFQYGMGF